MTGFRAEGPDFVGIGAQKAGTTWLHDNLEIQQGYWLPPVKELHFFNRLCPAEELLGIETMGVPPIRQRYRPAFERRSIATLKWLRRFYFDPLSMSWYRRLFADTPAGTRLCGEITPAYSTLDERGVDFARRVLKPDCRVFLIVRNPIDRIWSAVKMLYRWRGVDIGQAMAARLREELEAASNRLRSDYPRMIALWQGHFGDNFRVFLYDDLVSDPEKFLESMMCFLGHEVPIDVRRLRTRSNRDPARRPMPDAIRAFLTSSYADQIREMDRYRPGLSDVWLMQ